MANNQNTQLAPQEPKERKLTASERFMNKVVAEFSSGVGEIALTDFQKRLAQNYFIAIDLALKTAEVKRLAKKKDRDPLPVIWENVNMEALARNVVTYARLGLDPVQKNHISVMPFKNNAMNKYDIGFIEGYRGIELKAKKYGLDIPDGVVVELVYTNDKFKPIKKDLNNKYESYEFEVVDAFNRGEIKGGFYYHSYSMNPEKNKLVIFTLQDILKRKPKYASPEFWGGEKAVYDENGKKVGTEQVEGWFEKMCYKTVYRAAYNDITIDSRKIDDDYLRMKQMEMQMAEMEVEAEIAENANKEILDFDDAIDAEYTPIESVEESEPPKEEKKTASKAKEKEANKELQQIALDEEGPGY